MHAKRKFEEKLEAFEGAVREHERTKNRAPQSDLAKKLKNKQRRLVII